MIKPIGEKQYKSAWRQFGGSPLQSWGWGEVKSYNWQVERIGIWEDDELVSVVSIHLRKFPLQRIVGLLGLSGFAYIPRGFPVKKADHIHYAIEELTAYLMGKGIAFALIDPEKDLRVADWNDKMKSALEDSDWKAAGETIQPNWTDVIRIDRSEEDLLQNIRSKWRRNIRKAERHGVKVRELEGKGSVDKFYKVIVSVKQSTSFKTHDLKYFQRIWDKMSEEDLVKIYAAEHKGVTIAAYLVLVNDYQAYELYGGATPKGRDVEASYLLKWEIIKRLAIGDKRAASGNKRFYDQWGAAPKGDQNHSLSGISYFKSGFGGEHVEMLSQYVKVYRKLGYSVYKFTRGA
ncbi:MAG: peptidoglycan bridge formation glycyltransferase FemA/FemB family protein [Candidatus Dojkabacteria bacterium]|jgi:lipid II:glycine glycyltransferase (peptidoglycan interpeptide bridge formation enzyme)|nr:peptidoglycan bridge formation glycyltransferase FemA/FemB family protein [Candidatus Dojkabacteria bacterium]